MNPLVLHPLAAPPDRLRVWLGATQRTQAPALSWQLDGQAANPTAVRALTSARPDSGPNVMVAATTPRMFTGVFEFNSAPATRHLIRVTDDAGHVASLDSTTLPAAIPAGLEDGFNVLLVSCFHAHEDKDALAGGLMSKLPPRFRPHLTILMGDQVYLDLPTLKDFKPQVDWLAAKFEGDYAGNWCESAGYSQILHAAPSLSTPDDHEYWNDFPRVQKHLDTTWKQAGRDAWRSAARALYRAFQENPAGGAEEKAFELTVPPLAIFIMDTRTHRTASASQVVAPAVVQQFGAWIDNVIQKRHIALVAAGQSFLEPAAGKGATDLTIADHQDYPQIMQHVGRAIDAGRPVVFVTGDVHWGRVTEVVDIRTAQPMLFEVISSPMSLVTTIGVDQIKSIGSAIAGLFGKKNPWPRHADAKRPLSFLAQDVFAGRFKTGVLHQQKGNMVALLSFRRAGFGVELRVRYWSIHRDKPAGAPQELARALILLDS